MKKTKRHLLVLVLYIVVCSCTVTRTVTIQKQSLEKLTAFHYPHDVAHFLVAKDLKFFTDLSKIERISIPQNLVFDANGLEIVTFNEKLCTNHTLEFLKKYQTSLTFKNSTFTIDEYLKHFKMVGNNAKTIEQIQKSSKIRVFLNTATYGNMTNVNKEAFTIHKDFGDKFEIYVVNVDYLTEWDQQ